MNEIAASTETTEIKVAPDIEPSWKAVLEDTFQQDYFKHLKQFLLEEKRAGKVIYPAGKNIFNAFALTPWDQVKVLILGQDPYHGPNQAHGLAFSVQDGVPTPPSLQNIYKELHSDVGFVIPKTGNLTPWAKQGVMLLNTVLTVRAGEAHSHKDKGWEIFTDTVIRRLSEQKENIVFVLWGSPAQKKRELIDAKKHLILTAVHPSPLSAHRGFLGCKHFSKINAYLTAHKKTPIDWQL
jgi:uracil-DNA glycosylase